VKKRIKTVALVLIVSSLSVFSQNSKVGWWKFDDTANALKAEVGYGDALQLVGTDEFVEGYDTNDGAVKIGVGSHFAMKHHIVANGGGTKVNQYSILVDFKVENATIWHTFYQTNPLNDEDGECFINTTGQVGTWATTYTEMSIEPNTWYRLVISVENGNFYRYYINGELAKEGTSQVIDDRHSLDSLLLMFADNDGDDGEIFVSEVAIWDGALSSDEVAKIGTVGSTTEFKAGCWKFDDPANPLNAEVGFGDALQLAGADPFVETVEGFNGDDGAVKIGVGSYYVMDHHIAANGGGIKVNQYSLLVDFKVEDATIWHTFYQTNPINDDDGDCFINTTGQIGTWATTYTEMTIEPNIWYRLLISVENGNFYRYYINGKLAKEGTLQVIDDRHSLAPSLLMFADNDGEDNEIFVSEVAIWSKALTSAEVARIGAIDSQVDVQDENKPLVFDLSQNYPNPFNPTTTIKFSVLAEREVANTKLMVYNILGQQVAELLNKPLSAGNYQVEFNATNLPSGVYFYRLQSGNFTETKKMLLMK